MALVSDEKTPKDYFEAMAWADKMRRQRDQLREALEYAANHILGVTGCRPGSDSEEVYNLALAALKATEED